MRTSYDIAVEYINCGPWIWRAYDRLDNVDGRCGVGATTQEAIDDLLAQLDAPCELNRECIKGKDHPGDCDIQPYEEEHDSLPGNEDLEEEE